MYIKNEEHKKAKIFEFIQIELDIHYFKYFNFPQL